MILCYCRYIERFRHGAPVSREHRGDSHSTNKEDFWWLSPPTSTSTPNQPTESTVSSKYSPSTTTETSPKLRRKKFNKASSDAAPLQVCSIIRTQFLRGWVRAEKISPLRLQP